MKKEKLRTAEQEEMFRFVCVIIIVILCVAGVYLLTRAFVTKDLFKKDEQAEVISGEVKYDVAIVGQILNRPYDTYYVAVYNKTGDKASDMSNYIYTYQSKEDVNKLHIYTVDLANKLNADYYDPNKENTAPKDATEFMFGDATLLKIKDGKIEKYINDIEKIRKELGA